MSFKKILEEAEKQANEAIDPSKINTTFKFPDKPGVYLIYKNKKVIYIGQSKNLKKRFNKHLSTSQNPTGSTFRRILVREHDDVKPQNTREWILKNCSTSYIKIDDLDERDAVDMCKLVESLLIVHFRIRNKDLLNS